MRRFTSLCTDSITGCEMILTDCSFNQACSFLERENTDNKLGEYKGCECASRYVTKLIFENATFLYDEERGLLMRR